MTLPHRWLTPPSYNDGDNIWGGQNDYAIYGQGRVPIRELFVNHYNARFFGARGDGLTDDGPALRTALDTIRLAGGGTLHLPTGVYFCNSTIIHPVTGAGQAVGLVIGSNTRLVGDGPGATIIRFGSVANQAWLIANYQTVAPYSDKNITIEQLTLDGNAGIQTGAIDSQVGVYLIGAYASTHYNLEIKDVFGTTGGGNGPNGTPGEGMFYKTSGCDHLSYVNCRAISNGILNTSTGFSSNKSNNVAYSNCWAYGMKNGMGFTNWNCWNHRYVNCWSGANGLNGFNSELGESIIYDSCVAGGTSVPFQSALYNGAALGNTSDGFHLLSCIRAILANCIARNNGANGLNSVTAAGSGGSQQILGGSFTTNSAFGIKLSDAASVTATEIKGKPESGGNTSGDISANGTVVGTRGFATAPGIPASTVNLVNPFSMDMSVYILGGTVSSIKVDGVQIGTGTNAAVAVSVRVRANGTINLTYTVAPTWTWEYAS